MLGDATDSGLLRFCDKIMDVDDVRANFESVFSIPFNSRNKWALNMVRIPGDADNYLVLIKGAPDYVIKKCGRYSYRDGEHVMDDQFLADVMDSNEGYASMAERVIGHAYKVCYFSCCSCNCVFTLQDVAEAVYHSISWKFFLDTQNWTGRSGVCRLCQQPRCHQPKRRQTLWDS